MADAGCILSKHGDIRILYDDGQTNDWVDECRVDAPAFIFVNLLPLATHLGTGLERKMIRNINRLLNVCFAVSNSERQCVLYLYGGKKLNTYGTPSMRDLGERMFRSTVCWANLGIELLDGRLPRTESYVWSSAQSLPDLSGTRSDKIYASEP